MAWDKTARPKSMLCGEMHATLAEFMTEMVKLSQGCPGVAVVLFKDNSAHSYQFGLSTEELELSARAFAEHARMTELEH